MLSFPSIFGRGILRHEKLGLLAKRSNSCITGARGSMKSMLSTQQLNEWFRKFRGCIYSKNVK